MCRSLLPTLYTEVLGKPWNFKDVISFKENYAVRHELLQQLDRIGIDGFIHPVENSIYKKASRSPSLSDEKHVNPPDLCRRFKSS